MIPRITRGSSAAAALAYDFGPGRREEHVDARTVAGNLAGYWQDQAATMDTVITDHMNARAASGGRGQQLVKAVWRTSLRAAPTDRMLTDAEWGQVATRYITAMGLADHPWTATRHGDDHIHLTVSRVSWTGRVASLSHDFAKAQSACRAIEREHHLVDASTRYDRARPQVAGGEREFAARRAQVPEREQLRVRVAAAAEQVQRAMGSAAGARGISGEDREAISRQVRGVYEARLRAHGVVFRANVASTGRMSGYSYGLAGHTDAAGEQVFFKGSQLGKGYSWAATREHLGVAVTQAMTTVQAQAKAQARTREQVEQAQAAWAALTLEERMARLRQAGLGQAVRRQEVGAGEVDQQARQRPGQHPAQRPGRRPGWGAGSATGQSAAQQSGQQPGQQPSQQPGQTRRGLVSAAERERLRLEHEQIQARRAQRARALAAAEATHRQASEVLVSAQREWTAATRGCEDAAAGVSRARFEVDQVAGLLTRTRREIEQRSWATRVRQQLAEDLGTVTGGRAGVPRGQDQARIAVVEDHLRAARARLVVAERGLQAQGVKVAGAGQVVAQAKGAVEVAGQEVERARAVGFESTMSVTRYEALLDREARAREPEDVKRARAAAERQAVEHAEMMALRRSHSRGYGPERDQGHGYER